MKDFSSEAQAPEKRSRRVRPNFLAGVAATGIVLGTAIFMASKHSADTDAAEQRHELDTFDEDLLALNSKLAAIAKEITGKEVSAFCIPVAETGISISEGVHAYGAFVPLSPPEHSLLFLDIKLCQSLMHEAGPNSGYHNTLAMDGNTLEIARVAAFTLGHEITHMDGVINENLAECGAIELFPRIVDMLGINTEVANVDPVNYSIAYNLPANYNHASC